MYGICTQLHMYTWVCTHWYQSMYDVCIHAHRLFTWLYIYIYTHIFHIHMHIDMDC